MPRFDKKKSNPKIASIYALVLLTWSIRVNSVVTWCRRIIRYYLITCIRKSRTINAIQHRCNSLACKAVSLAVDVKCLLLPCLFGVRSFTTCNIMSIYELVLAEKGWLGMWSFSPWSRRYHCLKHLYAVELRPPYSLPCDEERIVTTHDLQIIAN